MYYPEELVEEIRQKNDVVDIISGYVSLKKKGGSYFGLCPFHNEKTGSFSVSRNKQMYYCFGCGAGGNVFSFLMNYENYTFSEAVKVLAERAGVSLPEAEDTQENRERENKRKILLEINKEAAKYFYYQLRMPQGKIGLEYFENRKLSQETMKQFGLGFSNKTSNDLVRYLKSKGYTDQQLVESGVAVFHEKYGMNDKFWNRVMFPIQDSNHRVIGFGGRVLGDGEPKYLNSPETPVFDKSRNLYGLNFARTSRKDNFILCEGYMDVIAMHQAGFNQAVASLGTAFTSGQANLLKRYTENVLLSYDSDGAGTKAALRAIGILREAGLSGKVINLSPYKDPDEFIKNLGKEAFQERIDNAENSFMFEIRMLQKDYDLNDPDSKTRFYTQIAKKLCVFSEDLERENYIEAVAAKYNMGVDNLRKMVVGYAAKQEMTPIREKPKEPISSKNSQAEKEGKVQRLLITWLIEQPNLYPKIKEFISPRDFTNELYREVATLLFADFEKGNPNPAFIISKFEDPDDQKEIAKLFNTKLDFIDNEEDSDSLKSGKQEREKAFHDIVVKVKKQSCEWDLQNSASDIGALQRVITGRKELEELEKKHISLD